MTILDYSNYNSLCVCGDIHGELTPIALALLLVQKRLRGPINIYPCLPIQNAGKARIGGLL